MTHRQSLARVLAIAGLICATRSAAQNASIHSDDAASPSQASPATFDGLDTSGEADPTGGFVTRVGIRVPAYHGIEPRLELSYNSSAGNGPLGVGWTLNGTSVIQRVSPGRGLPTWDDARDFYLLNGAEVYPCSRLPQNQSSPGCNSQAGPNQYIYFYGRVERYQRLAFDPNNNIWILWFKNGTRYEYSQPWVTRSNRTASWLLTAVVDPSQNRVQYNYVADNIVNPWPSADNWWLSTIQYNGVVITFWPEARADSTTHAMDDSTLATLRNRIKTIDVQMRGLRSFQRVRTYKLSYQSSGSSAASLLTRVQELGSDATLDGSGNITNANTATALPAVTLTYGSSPQNGYSSFTTGYDYPRAPDLLQAPSDGLVGPDFALVEPALAIRHVNLDLNGDGLIDHLMIWGAGLQQQPDGNGRWHVGTTQIQPFLALPGGGYRKLPVYDTLQESFWGNDGFHVGDVDGDGKQELIVTHYQYVGQWNVVNNDGNIPIPPINLVVQTYFFETDYETFSMRQVNTPNWVVPLATANWSNYPSAPLETDHILVADVNGDGLADLVRADAPATTVQGHGAAFDNYVFGNYQIQTMLGNGDGSFTGVFHMQTSWPQNATPPPNSYSAPWGGVVSNAAVTSLDHWLPGDINGDGRTDLIAVVHHAANQQGDPEQAEHWALCTAVSATADVLQFGVVPYQLSCYHANIHYYSGDWWTSGDINGDGKTDLYRITKNQNDGTTTFQTYLATFNGLFSFSPSGSVQSSLPWVWDFGQGPGGGAAPGTDIWLRSQGGWVAADLDGDGRSDLVTLRYGLDANTQSYNAEVTVMPRPVPGSEQVSLSFSSQPTTLGNWAQNEFQYLGPPYFFSFDVGDHDGDGRADITAWELTGNRIDLGQGLTAPGYNAFLIHSPRTVDDAHSWREADVNGDGLPDLVRISVVTRGLYAMNVTPGIYVETRLRGANGSLSSAPVGPNPLHFTQQMIGPRAAGFILADADGDGRTDILYPQYSNGTLQVLGLISQGDGTWIEQNGSVAVNTPMDDSAAWFAMDVNGDGRIDLVHVAHSLFVGTIGCNNQRQLQTDALIAGNTGSYSLVTTNNIWTCDVPRQITAWHPIDVNHDGKADLVGVWRDPWGLGLITYTLLADGAGGWTTVRAQVSTPDKYRNPGRWMAMDLNADGSTDLLSLGTEPKINGFFDVQVLGLVAFGDGTWQPTSTVAWGSFDLPDALNWRPADINGDRLSDLVHPRFNAGNVTVDTLTLWPQNGQTDFVLSPGWLPGPAASSQTPDLSAWRVRDLNGDGWTDLEHVTYSFLFNELAAERFISQARLDVVSTVDNGLGGSQSPGYASAIAQWSLSSPGSCRLPPGKAPQVVSSLTRRNQGQTVTSETRSYTCPVWSNGERRFLGWQSMQASESPPSDRPARYTSTWNDIGDACGARVSWLGQSSSITAETTWHGTQYVSPGAQPPYLCQPQYHYVEEGDINGVWTWSYDQVAYDAMGNLEWLYEYGDGNVNGDERTTHRQYAFAPSLFIATQFKESMYQGLGDGGTMVRDEEYCYDNQNPNNGVGCGHAASNRGLRTATVVWNDRKNESYVSTVGYDSYGNQTLATDANGHTTTTVFDNTYHLFPVSVSNALNQTTSRTWNTVLGQPITSTDANGVAVETRAYDAAGRLTSVTTADNGVTRYEYNALGTASQNVTTRHLDGSQDGLWSRDIFDGLGRVTRTEKKGDGIIAVYASDRSFGDASSRPWKTNHWYNAALAPSATETYGYDYLGRMVQTSHADLSVASVIYRAHERTEQDEQNHVRNLYTDGYGRVATVEELFTDGNGNAADKRSQYQYDVPGRLTQVQDSSNNLVVATWDSLGRKVKTIDPDMGTWSYDYDPVGNVTTQTDARHVTRRIIYDALNRRITKTNSLTPRVITWRYDENHPFSIGRLTSMSDSADANCPNAGSWSYDSMGRLASDTRCIDGVTANMNSFYDNLGRLQLLQYPDGEVVVEQYDPAGRLSGVPGYAQQFSYDPGGKLLKTTLANGAVEQFGYSPQRDWLTSVGISTANGNTYMASFGYYADGLVSSRWQWTSGINTQVNGWWQWWTQDNVGYNYDELHRLRAVTGDLPEHFTYDAIGNLVSSTSFSGTATYGPSWQACGAQVCGGGPHAMLQAGETSYSYDADGNMIAATYQMSTGTRVRSIMWNEDNRPTSITFGTPGLPIGGETLSYDADGERTEKIAANGSTTRYFGPLLEQAPNGSWIKYYHGGPRLIASRVGWGAPTYFHQDRLDSTRFLSDSNGNPVANTNYQYSAYGGVTRGQTALADEIAFTGQHQDEETAGMTPGYGLIYMHARYYDPAIGRFISADDMVPNVSNPQSLNRYSYVLDNPISHVDPTGHEEDPPPLCLPDQPPDMSMNDAHIDEPEVANTNPPPPDTAPPPPPPGPPAAEPRMEVGVQGLGGVLGFKLYLNLNKISDWALRTSLGLQSPGVSVGAAGTGVPQTDWGVRANASSFRVYGLAGPSVEATYYYVGGPNIKFSNGLLTERLNPDGTAASQYPEMNLGQNYNQESPKAVSGPSASVTLDFIVNSRDWGLLFGPFGPWFQHLAETPAPDNHRWLGDAYPGYHN